MIGRDVEQHGDARLERRESFRAGTTTPRRRPTSPAPGVDALPRSADCRCCRPTRTLEAARSAAGGRSAPWSWTLPFVPVTATIGALQRRYASSISPTTGTLASCRRRTTGDVGGTPGESTADSRCRQQPLAARPGQRSARPTDFGGRDGAGELRTALLVGRVARDAASAQARATLARPLVPRPITRTRFAGVEREDIAHRTMANPTANRAATQAKSVPSPSSRASRSSSK